jgi:hypothetical protein
MVGTWESPGMWSVDSTAQDDCGADFLAERRAVTGRCRGHSQDERIWDT